MSISSEQVQRLVDKATQRSGKIYRLPNCLTWRDSITIENGTVLLWYNTCDGIDAQYDSKMTTRVVTEPEEV
jgi:hypothetical protein